MHGLLGGIAAVALGLTAFAGRFEPGQNSRQSPPRNAADGVPALSGVEGRLPERPRTRVDTAPVSPTGRTIRVPAGGDLQAAINDAKAGDAIALEPGATYTGPFRLPRKDGDGWIVIAPRTERGLPPPGQRVTPSHAPAMSKLVASSGDAVIEADAGAHHYRLVGLEIAPADGVFLRALVHVGTNETDAASQPHHVIIDRCYLHGDPRKGTRRGIALNARDSAVVNSYLSDFKEVGADSQAVAGWNGAGPLKIANNYLEGAGENVMFGGADPSIPDLVPADIEIIGNHFSKPLRWKEGDATFEGTAWTVKNLFELKNARRVLVDGNLLEYNWPHGQNGFAILFTPRNQDGGAPWSVVEDVTFVNNVVRHVAAGINMLGRDDIHKSQPTRRIAILNNVFLDVGGRWGRGRLFQLLDGVERRDHRAQHGGPYRRHHVGRRSHTQPRVRLPEQHRGRQQRRHSGGRHRCRPADARALLPGRDRAPQRDRRRQRRALSGRQLFSQIARSSRLCRRPGVERAPDGLESIQARGYRQARPRRRRRGAPPTRSSLRGLRPLRLGKPRRLSRRSSVAESPSEGGPPHTRTMSLLFWISLFLLAYVYVGYPLVAWLRATLRPKSHDTAAWEPAVTVVVVAYNEQDRIAARLENLLALDYPREKLDICVASDGSTDATVARARAYESAGVVVQAFRNRRGKSAVLNDVVPAAPGEIVVMADARQQFDRGAVRALVANFADSSVGAVSGELMMTASPAGAAVGKGVGFYWRYEKFIRRNEGRTGSTVGATGAIYAIRRVLYQPIPDDTLLDDVLIPVRVVKGGYRVVFEPAARAYDTASATSRQEFVRKVRTIAGTFQLFARETWLFDPRRNPVWFETLSHKALRLATPVLQLTALSASIALAAESPYRELLLLQGLLYLRRAGRVCAPISAAIDRLSDRALHRLPVELGHDRRLRPVRHAPAKGHVGPRRPCAYPFFPALRAAALVIAPPDPDVAAPVVAGVAAVALVPELMVTFEIVAPRS